MLFVDIVGSTEHVRRFGDRKWRAVLADYYGSVKETVDRFDGTIVDTPGDGAPLPFGSSPDKPSRWRGAADLTSSR